MNSEVKLNKEEITNYDNAAEILKSLSHSHRLEILTHLVKMGNSNVSTLQKSIDLPQPTLSQHLARMHRSGVLSRSKRGTEVFYSVSNPAVLEGIKYICDINLAQ